MSESGESGSNGTPEESDEQESSGEPEPHDGSESRESPGSTGVSASTVAGTASERVGEARESGFPVVRGAVYGTLGVAVTYLLHLHMTVVTMSSVTPVTYTERGEEVTTNLVSEFVVAGWDYLAVFGVSFKLGEETVPLGLNL